VIAPAFNLARLLAVAALAASAACGAYFGRAPLQVQLAALKADAAETARLQAGAAANTLQQAQLRGDALTTALAQRQEQITQLSKDKRDALNRLTTGRACLSGAAVRVLNQPDGPADLGPEPVPPPPVGTAATGEDFATDTDIGQWAIAARAQYSDCRARLDALIDWHTTQSTGAAHGNGAD
jgi:hypothetical protein